LNLKMKTKRIRGEYEAEGEDGTNESEENEDD
jgi:hypothetical protein